MPKTGIFYISISFIAMYAANISTESNIIYLISLFIIIPFHNEELRCQFRWQISLCHFVTSPRGEIISQSAFAETLIFHS